LNQRKEKRKRNIHTGSSFNEFLESEGIDVEGSARALKKKVTSRTSTVKAHKSRDRK
jgi:hypothetical protein